jgi:hypothetical protein
MYIFRPWVLQQTGARLGGKIAIYRMDYLHSIQIDDRAELELAARLLPIYAEETLRPSIEMRSTPTDAHAPSFDGNVTVEQASQV